MLVQIFNLVVRLTQRNFTGVLLREAEEMGRNACAIRLSLILLTLNSFKYCVFDIKLLRLPYNCILFTFTQANQILEVKQDLVA